jgi:hypothetical protein
MKRFIALIFIPSVLALCISSCAMGGGDALEQLFESEDTLFVAGGNNNSIYISGDGITWSGPVYSVAGGGFFSGAASGANGFVSAGIDSGGAAYVVYSRDGILWAPVYGNPSILPRAVSLVGDAFVMAADEGILFSPNGLTWTQVLSSPSPLSCLVYGNGLMVASGSSIVYASRDGINWTITATPPLSTFYDAVFFDGTFYVVGVESGNNAIIATRDLVTASSNLITPYANELYGIAHGNGTFVAVGENGYVWVSMNGVSWNRLYPATVFGNTIRDVAFGNGRFVAVTDMPSIIYSVDGINWYTAQPPAAGFYGLNTITVRP